MSGSRVWSAGSGPDRAGLCSARDVRFRISGALVGPLRGMDWRGNVSELLKCERMGKESDNETGVSLRPCYRQRSVGGVIHRLR